jgi:hypothetical protein
MECTAFVLNFTPGLLFLPYLSSEAIANVWVKLQDDFRTRNFGKEAVIA